MLELDFISRTYYINIIINIKYKIIIYISLKPY
jgi:hypothetical protein